MKILKKLKRIVYNLLYSIPFGMDAVNKTMLENNSNIGINKIINNDNVANDLIKGEVTEQVKELRYRTYWVEHESKKYKYLGNGVGIKLNNTDNKWGLNNSTDKNFDIIQTNTEIVGSVEDELNRVGQYGKRIFTLHLKSSNYYNKFNNEEYVLSASINNLHGYLDIVLTYSIYPNKYDPISRILINKFEDALCGNIKNNDSVCNFDSLIFITNKAIGDDDYKQYSFFNLQLVSISKFLDKGVYEVKYEASEYDVKYLLDDYYNETINNKYNLKTPKKNRAVDITNDNFKYMCSDCGKLISSFDAKESKESIGKIVCLDCLGKYVK